MTSNYKDIPGVIVLTTKVSLVLHLTHYIDVNRRYDHVTIFPPRKLKAKPGKADEVAKWVANLTASVKNEPGTLRYNIVRHGDVFAVWEEYDGPAAVEAHWNGLFKEFASLKLVEDLAPDIFYPADSLPAPTLNL
ncbi:hypothetical protein DFH11DRAFT_1620059 [Phellopilus nigrolimitatus]|nr:hypothetical protein DFH11DRAFT_1620059 [Phellopilus nigrolimitatus]